MIKHIVFDIDRTLVDSFTPEVISLKEAIKNVTGTIINDKDMSKISMLTTKEFFDSLNISEDIIKLIYKEWDKTFKNYQTACFPGIKDVIKKIDKLRYSINIITSRTTEEVYELNDELNDIYNLFNIIVTSDIVNKPKPDIESMNYLCNKLNCKKDEVLYIGDSLTDRLFASNSSCYFIPACWENKELSYLENACFNPVQLLDMIKENKFIK